MEAMSIHFECPKNEKFAIRPFLGGVNGISGVSSLSKPVSSLWQKKRTALEQDYIVLPEQEWLHGIATRPGIMKQFVASKMTVLAREIPQSATPSGANHQESDRAFESTAFSGFKTEGEGGTIEWQVTGRDDVGGIQLQIIPQFHRPDIFAGSVKNIIRDYSLEYDDDQSNSDDMEWISDPHAVSWLWSFEDPPGQTLRPRSLQTSKSQQRDTYAEGLHEYDVLKSPSEMGLRPGDLIYVKDMKSCQQGRPKVLSDLLTEGPSLLASTDVIELELCPRKPKAWTFNVQVKDGSPALKLVVRSVPVTIATEPDLTKSPGR